MVVNKKDVLVYIFMVILLVVGIHFLSNAFAYFDVFNLCHIKISKDILRGNKRTIIGAIKKIKREDKSAYKTLCKNIDRISENFCIGSDWHLDPDWQKNAEGKSCYIRGSKTIYLYPKSEYSSDIVSERAEELKRLSKYSEIFWNSKEWK